MPKDNNEIIENILLREGEKFTMDPADPGGATKYGITQITLSEFLGRGVSYPEVENLTKDLAKDIYLQLYIVRPKYNLITDMNLKELVVDCAVNHGVNQATKWLQLGL